MSLSLRNDSHRRLPATSSSRPLTQNGVAERFPDWTAVGFRDSTADSRDRSCIDLSHVHAASRTLLLGSHALGGPFLAHSRVRWVRCVADRRTLSSRGDGSASTPFTSLTATLTRPACRALSSPLVPGGLSGSFRTRPEITLRSLAAGFRPARTWLLRRAFASKKPDSVTGAVFQFRRPLSCPTTKRNIRAARESTKEIDKAPKSYPPPARKQLIRRTLIGA